MPSTPAVFHVAAGGKDSWSGTLPRPNAARTDGPLATLGAARAAARAGDGDAPRRILVQGGNYFLPRPLVLGPEDSGLSLEATTGEAAVLYGGRRIAEWQRDGERVWSARLPRVAEGKWDFRMLVVNGRFCARARLPKKGHFTHLTHFRVPWMSTTGGGWKRKPTQAELTTMTYRAGDLGPWLNVKNAELTIYHMWDESVVGLAALDPKAHTLTFSNPAGHPPGAFGVRKYVVWNVREGMTEPGQWYLDRAAGKVVCWPLPGEDMADAVVIAPTAEAIIRLKGTKSKPVRNVTLRGLTLSVTNTPLRAGGFGAGTFDGAVSAVNAEDCRLVGLTVVNVGGQGIKGWNCTRLGIERCTVRHTGACGIKLSGQHCRVADNLIHHNGVAYPSGIALWCGGQRHHIVHNTIHHTPYTAIASGGQDHRIEHNRIHHAMEKLHDGAGIYITFCKRIVLRGNFIHDIADTGGYGASAYYIDEQGEDCLVEGNLSLRVARPSHNHMARRNTLRNNVFICDGDAALTFPKSSEYRLERNVIVAGGKVRFTNPAAITAMPANIVFGAKGGVEGVRLHGYQSKGTGPLKAGEGTLLTDPLLAEFERGVVRFAPDSPAARLGIKPIDVSRAGHRRRQPRSE